MKHWLPKRLALGLCLGLAMWAAPTTQTAAQSNMVTYVGNTGREQLNGVMRLSDGTVLVAGRATNLNWIPATAVRQQIAIPQLPSAENASILGINSFDTTGFGFVMRLSANMDSILAVAHFPFGTVGDVTRIRTNTAPGETTGDIYISGRRNRTVSPNTDATRGDGYYIAKLNGNFLTGVPTGCVWTRDVRGQQRRSNQPGGTPWGPGGEGDFKKYQPWDVQRDGKVIYVNGREFSDDWASMLRLKADGMTLDTVDGWPHQHVTLRGITKPFQVNVRWETALFGRSISQMKASDTIYNFVYNIPNTSPTQRDTIAKVVIDSIRYSELILKTNRNGSNLRSHNTTDFNLVSVDENGNGGRKGRFPDDLFYNAACVKSYWDQIERCNNNGPGYTGVSLDLNGNNTATQRVINLNIDRRNNDLYFGYSTWVQHPQALSDDFDPALVAFSGNGVMKWWARLYKQDTLLPATAPQFVDGVEIDYNTNQLVVLAQTIGDSPANFWRGDSLTTKPGGNGFQNRFSGTLKDNVNVRWLGKFNLNTGAILHATYVGEFAANEPNVTSSTATPNMDGWASPNAGNPNLANTVVTAMSLGQDGAVYIAGRSEGRTMTTANAFMKMAKPDMNTATPDSLVSAHSFVRVYSPSLDSVRYSSLLTGIWDVTDGSGGDEAQLNAILPTANGLFVTGTHQVAGTGTTPRGSSLPLVNVPGFGRDTLEGEAGILARLTFDCTNTLGFPGPIVGNTTACANTDLKFRAQPVAGATRYYWALPNGGNYTGSSRTDSITIRGAAGNGGGLRVVAVNACGVSPIAAIRLEAPLVTARPTAIVAGSPTQCVGATVTYRATGLVPGVTGYIWSLPNAGWQPASGNLADTITTADSLRITVLPGTTLGGQLRVRAVGPCGPSAFTILNRAAPANAPVQPDTIRWATGTAIQCVGSSRAYSVPAVTGATGYVWDVPAGWTGTSTTNTITLTPQPGATSGTLGVSARNNCGSGTIRTRILATPATPLSVPVITLSSANVAYLTTPRLPGVTYQWRRGNTNLPSANDTVLNTQNVVGTYTLVATNACGSVTSNGVQVVSIADQLTKTSLSVYPNPSSGVFTLEHNQGSAVQVRVISLLGKEIGRFTAVSGKSTLDLTNQPKGMYFLEISNGGQKVVQRIEKQ